MGRWPKHPLIYEINTWVWLGELSRNAAHPLDLATVPDEEWDRIASLGCDVVWLMGVWERSPEGIRISMANDGLLADFRQALPDFTNRDNVGSPYCVRGYRVDEHLGGPEALAVVRSRLADRGLSLILDFVPNHVAPDHPWVNDHPEYFIRGDEEDLERAPHAFTSVGGRVYACGRDPYFPAWPDVLQLNAFDEGMRSAAMETLTSIASQCDGVRCDRAMLLMSSIFEKTWSSRAGGRPGADYWPAVISAVKERHPELRFIAEAYWDLEWELQQQGFDYCYDKRLYDRLEHERGEDVRMHLCADVAYQEKLARFIENHDEARAAAAFSPEKHRAAALTALTLPGARLIHEGQMEARRVRLPVFLARRPEELPDEEMLSFYGHLLKTLHRGHFLQGDWLLCETVGWPDNATYRNLVSWCWKRGPSRCLIVVNLSDVVSQGLIRIPWMELKRRFFWLKDVFTATLYKWSGDEMCNPGLYVDLPPWGFHFFEWQVT
jgi:glycosidase